MSITKVIQVFSCCECPYSKPNVETNNRTYFCRKIGRSIEQEKAETDFEYPEDCPLEY